MMKHAQDAKRNMDDGINSILSAYRIMATHINTNEELNVLQVELDFLRKVVQTPMGQSLRLKELDSSIGNDSNDDAVGKIAVQPYCLTCGSRNIRSWRVESGTQLTSLHYHCFECNTSNVRTGSEIVRGALTGAGLSNGNNSNMTSVIERQIDHLSSGPAKPRTRPPITSASTTQGGEDIMLTRKIVELWHERRVDKIKELGRSEVLKAIDEDENCKPILDAYYAMINAVNGAQPGSVSSPEPEIALLRLWEIAIVDLYTPKTTENIRIITEGVTTALEIFNNSKEEILAFVQAANNDFDKEIEILRSWDIIPKDGFEIKTINLDIEDYF